MIDRKRVSAWAEENGISLTEAMLEDLDRYAEAVARTNEMFNLTALTEPDDMEIRNIIDSMSVVPLIPQGSAVADVGTGAGFPGMVIKILRPDVQLTLIEATNKNLDFVLRTAAEMGYEVKGYHMRSEDAARGELRGTFDVVTARAVAALPALLEYTLPLLRKDGILLAMKGPSAAEEIEASANALKELCGSAEKVHEVTLPGGECRAIVEVKLRKDCPARYPRTSKNIRKQPL